MSCENCDHDQLAAGLAARLDHQIELLAEIAQVLATKRGRVSQQAVADASGFAQVTFPVPGGVTLVWLIERVTAWTNSTGTPTFGLYVMDSIPLNTDVAFDASYLTDYTNAVIAVGDESAPVLAKGGEIVIGQWQGLSANALCKLRLQYRQAWQGAD